MDMSMFDEIKRMNKRQVKFIVMKTVKFKTNISNAFITDILSSIEFCHDSLNCVDDLERPNDLYRL